MKWLLIFCFAVAVTRLLPGDCTEVTTASSANCPDECQCDPFLSKVDCVNTSLYQVPFPLPPSVQSLQLHGNYITKLPTGILAGLQALQFVDLSWNNIHHMNPSVFSHLSSLQQLHLEGNQITAVITSRLALPRALKTLHLGHNKISGVLVAHPSWSHLSDLRVQYNEITKIPASEIAHLVQLRTLNASHNCITAFNERPVKNHTTALVSIDLSWNHIAVLSQHVFISFPNLSEVYLQGNPITVLPNGLFSPLPSLRSLDISWIEIEKIPANCFSSNKLLHALSASHLPNLTTINPSSFSGLKSLQVLHLSYNKKLSHLHIHTFRGLQQLTELDLSNNGLRTLHEGIFQNRSSMAVKLQGNPWVCDCNLKWLIDALSVAQENDTSVFTFSPNDLICAYPYNLTGLYLSDIPTSNLSCQAAVISQFQTKQYFRIGTPAVLNCVSQGVPYPATMWTTARRQFFHHHTGLTSLDDKQPKDDGYHSNHSWHQSEEYPETLHEHHKERIHVLHNGSLYIDYVMRHDAGPYTCFAVNDYGNFSVVIHLRLDYWIVVKRTHHAMLIGAATAGSALILAILIGIIRTSTEKCCRERRLKKRRTIKEIIESLEAYRSAKLDKFSAYRSEKMDKLSAYKTAKVDQFKHAKELTVTSLIGYLKNLRDHYTSQMTTIKENCSDQARSLREKYSKKVSKFKDYKTHRIEKIRENYSSQVNKIKEYGSSQLEKLRDQYKLQQQHVLKLLELLNLDNCRGVVEAECIRTESMLFDPELIIDIPSGQVSVEPTSFAESEEYVTASSNSDLSSQDNQSGVVTFNAGIHCEPPESPNPYHIDNDEIVKTDPNLLVGTSVIALVQDHHLIPTSSSYSAIPGPSNGHDPLVQPCTSTDSRPSASTAKLGGEGIFKHDWADKQDMEICVISGSISDQSCSSLPPARESSV